MFFLCLSSTTPYSQFSPLAIESNGHTYINLLSPPANETAILFGSGTSAVTTAYETTVNAFDNSAWWIIVYILIIVAVEPENPTGIWTSAMEVRAIVMEYTLSAAQ